MSNDSVIDTQFGLNQLSGNEALLITLLSKFAEEYASAGQKIENLIAQKNWEEARVYLHTLKGVSGNLGCNKLHEQTRLAEQFMKSNSSAPPNLSDALSVLSSTLSTIEQIKAAGTIDIAPGVNTEATEPASHDQVTTAQTNSGLTTALENHEFIPHEQLEPWLNELSTDIREEVREAIDELDYDFALQLLKK